MNILLTSVGRRSYLVQYFKKSVGPNGKIHVANSSSVTPAFQVADFCTEVPLIYSQEYIPFLKKYCKDNSIDAIISLFDIDLPILAAHKAELESVGTKVVVSPCEVIDICNDKWKTFEYMSAHGFNVPKTYLSIADAESAIKSGELEFPVIVKPRWGMASIGVFEADNSEELAVLYNKAVAGIKKSYLKFESDQSIDMAVIIQEKLPGQEYGLDIINDLNGKYQNTIVKKKMAMRAGETDCAETVDDEMLKQLGRSISESLHHFANLDVDLFLVDGVPYILEMNARFGGGYPFSHMAGVDLPSAIVSWLEGKEVPASMLQAEPGVRSHKDLNIVRL